jgi:hypothetical protein
MFNSHLHHRQEKTEKEGGRIIRTRMREKNNMDEKRKTEVEMEEQGN